MRVACFFHDLGCSANLITSLEADQSCHSFKMLTLGTPPLSKRDFHGITNLLYAASSRGGGMSETSQYSREDPAKQERSVANMSPR